MENLTVIIPFYNEENFLRKSIERVLSAKIADNLILVDDCSTDNSFNIATEITKDLKFVKNLTFNKSRLVIFFLSILLIEIFFSFNDLLKIFLPILPKPIRAIFFTFL